MSNAVDGLQTASGSVAGATAQSASSEISVRVRGLEKHYGEVVALAGIDLDIRRGECFGLLGPNGAGKSTACDLLMGMLQPTRGTIEINRLTWQHDTAELRQRVCAQFQDTHLYGALTVFETVRLFRSFYRKGISPDEAITAVELREKRDALVNHLSGGQRQRLSIACLLVADPEVALFDEPTTGLDAVTRRALWAILETYRRKRRTVLLTTHYLEEAERLCDRVAIIDRGRVIACDTPAALVQSRRAACVIELRTSAPIDTRLFDGIEPVSAVTVVEECTFRLAATSLHAAVPAVLDRLRAQRVEVVGLVTRQPTLEDVFVELTGPGSEGSST